MNTSNGDGSQDVANARVDTSGWSAPSIQAQRWLYEVLYKTQLARTMWDRTSHDALLERWTHDLVPARALDVGCGTGSNALYLASRGHSVDAIDFSSSAIAQCQARTQPQTNPVRWIHADVFAYNAEPYELVVDFGCLHNLDVNMRARYAATVASLTRPGGHFILMALAPRYGVIDWRLLGPHHLATSLVATLFEADFRLVGKQEIEHYWTHSPRAYRPLSGPYRAMGYHFQRRG